jgi:hypothetical protein
MIDDLFTLEAVSTEILEAYGSTDPVSREKAYKAVNRALRIISRKGTWPFFREEDSTFTTANGVETYRLKSRVKLPKFLHMRNPARKLRFIDLRELRILYPDNTTTQSAPMYWRVKNYNVSSQSYEVALWPIPDGIYTIYLDADKNPDLLVNKNDDLRSTGLPEEMIETVINIGISLMFEKTDDAMYREKYAEAMTQLDDDWSRLGQHPDDNLTSREYGGAYSLRRDDPQLDPSKFGD